MKKKILITGCAGFIGSNLVDFFFQKKFPNYWNRQSVNRKY